MPEEVNFSDYFQIAVNVTVFLLPVIYFLQLSMTHQPTKIYSDSKSNWWTPLWNGLLLEPDAKHYKAMGRSLWLYLYLLTFANRSTGKLFRRLPTVVKDTGIGIRTVRRWLEQLKQNGYIKTRQTGRSLEIEITKWKPIKK